MISSLKLKARLRPKAAALLSIVLIIGGIAGVTMAATAFIVSRDVQLATRLEESTVAYHASSGGIELGLLYQKFNRDIQLGEGCLDANDSCNPVTEKSLPIRIYLDRLGCSKQELENGTCSSMPLDPTDPTKHKIIDDTRPTDEGLYWMVAPESKYTVYLPADEHVVDLKIWFMGEKLGDPTFFNAIDSYLNDEVIANSAEYRILEKDQPISISIDKTKEYTLYWHPVFTDTSGKKHIWDDRDETSMNYYVNCFPKKVLLQRMGEDALLNKMKKDEDDKRKAAGTNTSCGLQLIKGNPYSFVWGKARTFFEAGTKNVEGKDSGNLTPEWPRGEGKSRKIPFPHQAVNELRFKPINTDIIYAFGPGNEEDNILIDTFVTHIESTGYYGSTQRKQEARIDRQKNQLLGIFDYAVFSGGKLVKPRP